MVSDIKKHRRAMQEQLEAGIKKEKERHHKIMLKGRELDEENKALVGAISRHRKEVENIDKQLRDLQYDKDVLKDDIAKLQRKKAQTAREIHEISTSLDYRKVEIENERSCKLAAVHKEKAMLEDIKLEADKAVDRLCIEKSKLLRKETDIQKTIKDTLSAKKAVEDKFQELNKDKEDIKKTKRDLKIQGERYAVMLEDIELKDRLAYEKKRKNEIDSVQLDERREALKDMEIALTLREALLRKRESRVDTILETNRLKGI